MIDEISKVWVKEMNKSFFAGVYEDKLRGFGDTIDKKELIEFLKEEGLNTFNDEVKEYRNMLDKMEALEEKTEDAFNRMFWKKFGGLEVKEVQFRLDKLSRMMGIAANISCDEYDEY